MKRLVAGCLLLFSMQGVADTRFLIGLGAGDVAIPGDLVLDSPSVGEGALALSGYVGHQFENSITADLGISMLTDDVFLGANDNMRFVALEALVGYRFLHDKAYVEPKIGYARWRRDVKEGKFLNPGAEAERTDYGVDPLYMLTAGYRLSDSFGLSLSYRYQELNDQRADAVLLGLGFPF